jgi:hypothetical protein
MGPCVRRDDDAHTSTFPRRMAPEFCNNLTPQEGAGNAGCAMHPQPRVEKINHTSVVTTGFTGITRHSLRDGFTVSFVLSPVIGLV